MHCRRCNGLMVEEEFCDLGSGTICFPGYRCLLCGAIEDPVIRSNRDQRPAPRVRPKARLSRSVRAGE